MADVIQNQSEKILNDKYSPEESLNTQADKVLSDLGFTDESTGIPVGKPPDEVPPAESMQPPEAGAPPKAAESKGPLDIKSTDSPKMMAAKKITEVSVGATLDLSQEVGNFAIDVANSVDNWMKERGYTNQDFIKDDFRLDYANKAVPQSEDGATRVARRMASYLIPFTGSMKALGGVRLLNTGAKAFAAGAATGFIAIDPDEKNLSAMVQEESDLLAPIAGLMATDPNNSRMENRFKNAMESLAIDTAFAGATSLGGIALKHIKAVKAARSMTQQAEKIAEATKAIEAEGEGLIKVPERVSSKDIIPGSDVNLLTITQEPDLLKVLKASVQKDLPGIQAARGTKGLEAAKAEAEAIKAAPERIQELLKSGEERILNASETIAANQLYNQSLKELKPIIDKALKSGKSVDLALAHEAFDSVKRIQRVVYGNKAEQGRALASHKVALESAEAAKKAEYIANVIELRGGKASSREDLLAVSQALDVEPSQIVKTGNELVEKSLGRKLFDAAFEVRINGLVSGPKTLAVSLGNGLFRAPLEIAERGIASLYKPKGRVVLEGFRHNLKNYKVGDVISEDVFKALPKRFQAVTRKDQVFFAEAKEMTRALYDESTNQFYAILGGLFDGAKLASHPKITKYPAIADFLKTQGESFRSLPKISKALESQKNLPEFLDILQANKINKSINAKNFGIEGSVGKMVDGIGSVISAPVSLLQRTDRAVGAIHYRMEARALATREAMSRGLKGDEAQALIKELTESPPDSLRPQFKELANQIKDQAVASANVARFLNPLEGVFSGAEKAVGAPFVRVFVPFARIDLNILAQSMERIPGLNRYAPGYRAAMSQGGAEAAKAQAKVALGGVMMMGIGAMTMQGLVTGDGPKDPGQRKLLEAQGWQPNSIRIGDTYIRYDRAAEPIARAMKLAANMAEISGFMYGEMKDENLSSNFMDLASAAIGALGTAASPDFLAGGLGDIINLIENRDKKSLDPIIKQVVTGQVPFSSLLRTVRQEVDPAKRQTRVPDDDTFSALEQQLNEIRNLVPGLSSGLPPQRNMFGDVVNYPAGLGPDMISPVYTTEFKHDPVIDEMVRLGSAGPLMHPVAKPGEEYLTVRMPSNMIRNGAAGVSQPIKMTPKQYDRYVLLAAGIGLEGVDMTLKDKLKEIIESDYSDFDGMEKTDQLKRTVISKYVESYRSAAQAQLVMEEPDIQVQMQENFDNISRAFGGEGL